MAFYFVLALVLAIIAWQDFKSREITVWLFPLLLLVALFHPQLNLIPLPIFEESKDFGVYPALPQLLANISIIVVMLGVSWVYFKLIRKQPIAEKIGVGDVLMFFAIIPLYEPLGFLFTIQLSAVAGILVYLIFRNKLNNIPLAGIMAVLILTQVALERLDRINFFTDKFFLTLT